MRLSLNRRNLIPVAEVITHFSKYLVQLKNQHDPFFITKDNKIEAVFLKYSDYEELKKIQELYEEMELTDIALKRLEKPVVGSDLETIMAERGIMFDDL